MSNDLFHAAVSYGFSGKLRLPQQGGIGGHLAQFVEKKTGRQRICPDA